MAGTPPDSPGHALDTGRIPVSKENRRVAHVGKLVEVHFTPVAGRGEMEADRSSSEAIGHGLSDHRPDG
jgi:hypothetical protein